MTADRIDRAAMDAVLTTPLLERIRDRAPGYDEANAFCHEDLAELAEAGYLRAHVPQDDGGLGWNLPTLSAAQRLLASYAPATALAVNMHHVWVATAVQMVAGGHETFGQVLREAAAGEIFAFGISEPGNDAVLFDSTTEATVRQDGSVSYTGIKIFTTLTPVWTRLGIFGKDVAGGEQPLVFGFLPREASGWSTLGEWDVLGMRATHSYATQLQDAVVPAERVVRRLPTGPNPDPLIFSIFSSFLSLIASVYTGVGDRALQLGVEDAARRTALTTGTSMDQDADVRYRLAEAKMDQLALDAHLRGLLVDIDAGAAHGSEWFPRLVTLRTQATRTARRVLEAALHIGGGSGYARGSELSRLYRDALAGLHHPSKDDSAHRTVANALLGPLQ
ncbi:acyl-CoA dehydrogenase family protein [Nesterenkonia aerolata]|uniref:Acyl-CoA dehydrogenase family protein n=1 Tax=Nesterenkonia aerolata TaxID=3074079 RepID=A0ABU2DQH0_9MICC|nr:acyl-CoA dehydrogenase family protein [Nesterenkonia sp. LY-0111]MDR8018615.1 acyl-CoA dehydrogenase family protein [Nesterenkonia sp. LY-0111]